MKISKAKERLSMELKALFIAAIIFLITTSTGGCATMQTQAKEINDSISNLSFSHDSKKVIFDRCRNRDCQIQAYDLETGELSQYQSPQNEQWTMAKYSDDGNKLVFSIFSADEKTIDLSKMQIGIMDVDGKNYRKLTDSPFPKLYPTFSHSGKKVLYSKASRMRKKGRTPAGDFDAWEVDVATGKETRLTYFEYMQLSSLFYFPDDETILYSAHTPFAFPGLHFAKDDENRFTDVDVRVAMQMIGEEAKKKNVPLWGILTLKKGEKYPQRPYDKFEKGHPPIHPILSSDGKLYFEADGKAGSFYLYSEDGNHKFIVKGGQPDSWVLSPNGELLAICYSDLIIIKRIIDNKPYRSIGVPTEKRRGATWDEEVKKKPWLRVLPEQPAHFIKNN